MKRLVAVLSFVLASAACDSPTPTAPASSPSSPNPTFPVRGAGPSRIAATTIAIGDRIHGVVEAADPGCFPAWDATGRCRAYEVVAPMEGTLVANLTDTGPTRGIYDPEVFLVAPDGAWTFSTEGWPDRQVSFAARSGLSYLVVVISYGPFPDAFTLKVEMQ